MDRFLIWAAIMLFAFGVLLLFKPETVKKLSDFLNKSIFPVEDKMRSAHITSGIILVLLSIVIFYLAVKR